MGFPMIDPRIEDWRDFANLPWNEYKHLERDKFEELLDCSLNLTLTMR